MEQGESHLRLGGIHLYSRGHEKADNAATIQESQRHGDHSQVSRSNKIKVPTVAMAVSKTFGKLTYAIRLQFFDEGGGRTSSHVVKACLAYYSPGMCYPVIHKMA